MATAEEIKKAEEVDETGAIEEFDATEEETDDSLTFGSGVIEKIVALGIGGVSDVVDRHGSLINRIQGVFGVRDIRKGISVEVTASGAVKVNVSIIMAYGAYAPKVFDDVKAAIVEAITSTTGLEVAGVSLRVEEILTPEEIEAYQAKANLPGTDEAEAELPEAAEE